MELNDPLDVVNLKLLGIGFDLQYSETAMDDKALFPWTLTISLVMWEHTWYF